MEDIHNNSVTAAVGEPSVIVKTEVELDMYGSGMGEDIMAWLSEETPSDDEVMNKLLEVDNSELMDSNCNSNLKVRFVDNPYSSSMIFQTTPSSYVTINGNEESCGSSFSDWESSVMATVDVGCRNGNGMTEDLGVVGMMGLEGGECECQEDMSWASAPATTQSEYDDAELATFLGLEFL
ncbi:hypothetical protein FNV43_RR17883 [Rhamnella rubrinervis]|uniref:Uncharacterized protein n=1 Tax=Rhamnella rubrinervis TaxID=2594499 RepID=A0A8K0E552_9ROSA|nr:hypothetical protein FNV43_RR17883 [Rhamnella rubrinervis]